MFTRISKIFLYFLAFFINLSCFSHLSHKTVQDILPEFEIYVKKAQKEWNVPGVSIAIIENGNVSFINSRLQNFHQENSITENSIFCIMSCSKIITVATLQQLVDEGKLSLEDKVIDHLPWFKLKDDDETKKVTIRHLISHCIGLPSFSCDTLWHLGFSQQEILQKLSEIDMKNKVGEKYGYQNAFVGIAGLLIEKVTGQPLKKIIQAYIFDKIGMDYSSLGPHPSGLWHRILQFFKEDKRHNPSYIIPGYQCLKGKPTPLITQDQYVFEGTSGVNSCTSDFIKFIACLINRGIIEFGPLKGQRLFSEKAWNTMSSAQIKVGHIREDNTQFPVRRIKKGSFYYGNGMFGMKYGKDRKRIKLLFHMGAGSAWRSLWAAVPDYKMGIVIFTNYGSIGTNLLPEALAYKFLDTYFNFSKHDWNADILKKQHHIQEYFKNRYNSYIMAPSLDIEKLEGNYQNDFYGDLKIQEKGGKLILEYRNRKIPLHHIGGTVFSLESHLLTPHYGDNDVCTLYFQISKEKIKGLHISLLREGNNLFKKKN